VTFGRKTTHVNCDYVSMNTTSPRSIEVLKHRLAAQLEERKWQFKERELQYLEAGQHLRSLNQLMWQVPSMVIAITGGLWYGATTIDESSARSVVLAFAAVFGLLTIVIIWRLRQLIQLHIERQNSFASGGEGVAPRGKYIVIGCWTVALLCSSLVSGLGALHPASLSKKQALNLEPKCCVAQVEVVTMQDLPLACPAEGKRATSTRKPCAK